jgi:hypothetical protein
LLSRHFSRDADHRTAVGFLLGRIVAIPQLGGLHHREWHVSGPSILQKRFEKGSKQPAC